MKRVLKTFYIVATMLIVVGALLILQSSKYGLSVLVAGLVINIIYRIINLPWQQLLKLRPRAVMRFLSILLLGFACAYMYGNDINKFNFLIIAIVIDMLVHLKEDTRR